MPGGVPAQDKTKDKEKLPELPPTKVEADPKTPKTPTDDLPPQTPPDQQPDQNQDQSNISPISNGGIFGSAAADGYRAGTATSATRIDAPLLSIPGSVSIVTQQTIQDQQAYVVTDVLRDIGATFKSNDNYNPNTVNIRGFELGSRDYRRNGFRDPSRAPRDTINIDRIEVFKGPASVLYGSGQPAGIINVITKQPLNYATEGYFVNAGSFDLFRTTLDATGPVNQNGSLLYRLTAAYEDTGGFRDFYTDQRNFVNPSLTFLLDQNTSLNIEYQHQKDRRRFDSGIIAINKDVTVLPINRFLGEPNDFINFEDHHVSATLVHRFSDTCYLRIGGMGMWNNTQFADTSSASFGFFNPPGAPPFFPAEPTLFRTRENTPVFDVQYQTMIADLAWTSWTGLLEHKMLIGTELGWFRDQFDSSSSNPFLGQFSGINPFNPKYGGVQPPISLNPAFTSDIQQNLFGFYAQDLIDLNKQWQLLAGVRYDIADSKFVRAGQFSSVPGVPFESQSIDTAVTPRLGLVYQPIPEVLAFYGSYSESFNAFTGTFSFDTTQPKPETGQSWEGGVKADLFNKNLIVTACGFHITKQNVVAVDNAFLYTQIGAQRSQGFEFSANGRITSNLSIIANYAYVDSEITNDSNPNRIGNQFRNVPFNNANVWARYNLIDDGFQTLGFAIGMVWLDRRPGDLDGTFELPSYVRFDGGVYYRRGLFQSNVYLENLFDRTYYASSLNDVVIQPGAPFNLRAQVGLQF